MSEYKGFDPDMSIRGQHVAAVIAKAAKDRGVILVAEQCQEVAVRMGGSDDVDGIVEDYINTYKLEALA